MPSLVRHSRLLQFADDTISENYNVIRNNLNSDMVQAWITSSRTRLNVQKSSVMWFSMKMMSSALQS